jgi:conjugal transfer pilus assembly protein TraB
MADQSIPAADNGTVACLASAKDLTRISLAGDQFASVSKIGAGGLAALIIGSSWIFAGENKSSDGNVKRQVGDVSVDEMVNKNMAEKEWRAQSEAQMMSMDNNMRALAARAQRADQLEAQLAQSQAQGGVSTGGAGISPDTERVLTAYQNENEQLKAALAAARQSPIMGQPVVGPGATSVGPNALYGRTSPPSYQAPGTPAGQAAMAAAGVPGGRGSEVSLVSFGEGTTGTGSPVPKGNTVFTDSANYLPPNSIAVAKVIVGVDAAAGVQSQTDPLPVVLRITGPARSVYDNGRLLTTNSAWPCFTIRVPTSSNRSFWRPKASRASILRYSHAGAVRSRSICVRP